MNYSYLLIVFIGALLCAVFLPLNGRGQVTINWTGGVSTNWGTAGNWSTGSVPAITDSVQIGAIAYSRRPVISANANIAFLLFSGTADTLTVNSGDTLRVGGTIIQAHLGYNIAPNTIMQGAGAAYCASFIVGNGTLPKVVVIKASLFESKIASLNITGDLVIRSYTTDLLSGAVAHNNGIFSLEAGQLNLAGRLYLDNVFPAYMTSVPGLKPLSKFQVNINSGNNAVLKLTDSAAVTITHPGCDSVDFYRHSSGSGLSIVNYAGGNQLIYTNNMPGIDTLLGTYQNLYVTGSGIKIAGDSVPGNKLTTAGDMIVGTGTLDLQTFSAATVVNGNFSNRATIDIGSPGIIFKGASFVNAGTFNYNDGMVTFSGGTQSLTDSTTAHLTNFKQVTFADTGTKSVVHGTFAMIPSGRVYLNSNVTVMVDTTGTFILRSDSTGTAAITAIPSGSVIKGIINAECFVKGSPTSTAMRTYRLLSSPVNTTAKTDGTGVYNTHWLQGTTNYNGAIVTGLLGSTNGFDTTANPTMYLYREDVNYNSGGFTTGPNRGINKIKFTDIDSIGTQKRFTITELADTLIKLPIANGILFFFRGNKIYHNGTTTGSKISTPFNYPESVTFTNKGTANQGQVQVHIYFKNNNYLSYTDSSYISNATNRGFNSVGNPYPSSINWDNFSATDSTASIYGPGLKRTITIFDPTIQNYTTYAADSTHDRNKQYFSTGGGNGSNVIYSGQGFFVQVDPASPNKLNASLRFREPAKFNPPDTTSGLLMMARRISALKTAPKSAKAPSVRSSVTPGIITPVNQAQFVHLSLTKDKSTAADIIISFQKQQKNIPILPDAPPDPDVNNKSSLSLSTNPISQNGGSARIYTLPPKSLEIPLYVKITQGGDYTLKVEEMQNLASKYAIKLQDNLTGRLIDLVKSPRYAFKATITDKKSYSGRFVLRLLKKN
ncbi:MAG: hypothetical protein ACHQHN_04255 [Sphingobacteriales bacterium]